MAFYFYLLGLILLAMIALTLYMGRNNSYWKKRKIPYLKPSPIVGNILKVWKFQQNIGQFFHECYFKGEEPFLGVFILDEPSLLIRDREICKHVLVKDFDYFADRGMIVNSKDDPVGSAILFLDKSPQWRWVRSKLTPVFSTGKLKQMFNLMVNSGQSLNRYIKENNTEKNTMEIGDLCGRYSTDVISTCALGVDSKVFKEENSDIRVAAKRFFDWTFSRSLQVTCYFFAPTLVKLFKMKFLDGIACDFMSKVCLETMHKRKELQFERGDVIDYILKLKENSPDLEDHVVLAQAIQFFIAGFETSSTTLKFILYELCLNFEIQDRLRKEIKSVLKNDKEVTYEILKEMPYLRMVLDESLRKYPILSFLDRICSKDYQIPGHDLVIEKGMKVYISVSGLQYDPKYFPDPEKFDPERFSPENKQSIPSYSYIPFGEGPRNCIGARFGIQSLEIGLIHIIKDFEVSLSKETEIPLKLATKGLLIAPANDIHMKFTPIE